MFLRRTAAQRHVFLIALAMCAAAAAAGEAHHPYTAYDLEHDVTITGEVVRVTYAEPHSYIQIRARGIGRDVTWIAELRGVGRLRAEGLTPQTIASGERVSVTGSPARVAADRRLQVKKVIRLRDGWTWSAS